MTPLLPYHAAETLAKSTISEKVTPGRGYWTATRPRQLKQWFGLTGRLFLLSTKSGEKTGLDDVRFGGHTRDHVLAPASDQLRACANDPTSRLAPTSSALHDALIVESRDWVWQSAGAQGRRGAE
jgi:hypothetical protein